MATVRCPYCAEEILADAQKCRFCGEWLKEAHDRKGATPTQRGSSEARALNRGLKQKEVDDFGRNVLSFLVLVAAVVGGFLAQTWVVGVAIVLVGAALIAIWYYRE